MTALALLTLVLSLVLAPSSFHAQAGAKTPRIGILTRTFDPHAPASIYEAFRQGLRDLGYAEGQSIALEYRSAEGQDERFPALAAELVRLKVDLILAESAPAVRAAQHASGTIPIDFPAVFDPVNQGARRQPGASGFPGENAKFYTAGSPPVLSMRQALSLTSASNELMRRCLLRRQDERRSPTFQHR
jgi:ABC-type uncharacterized transport system substrate-binding protein